MKQSLTEKTSFDLIRYANCWEDAEILLKGLDPKPGSRILSIGSAGDNSFSLLTTNPEVVVAIDVNKIQLHLIELKKVSIQHLQYEDLLKFLGFKPCNKRLHKFDAIKGFLSREALKHWENNINQIKNGIVSQGKFEHYFQLFSKKVLPWIHTQKRIEDLLKPKDAKEQKIFYDKYWNTWRWRLLFKVFFSKYVMGKFGRDPEFLKEVKISVGEYILMKAGKHLQSPGAQHNFMLRYNLTGSFGIQLPHYLCRENYELVKANLDKLHIREGYAQDAIQEYGKFHAMNLSNIFEYMDIELFVKTASQLVEHTTHGGRIAYWNLMVPRRISGIIPEKVEYLRTTSHSLSEIDKGFFYNQFIIDQVK
jgi:S-adenosylmethionine-diacylglycerol 3-amino-3-carboxypropyl transferase